MGPIQTSAACAALVIVVGLASGCAAPQCCGPRTRSVTVDEIDAAGGLSFDPSRAEALERIASRPTLTPGEQAHLVCVTVHEVNFDPNREQVLMKLVENPAFSPRAKACILRNFDRFSFDAARVNLLRAMEGRGEPAHPADELPPPG